MDLKAGVRIIAALVTGGAMLWGGADGVGAGAVPSIDVTATAECDGTVTGVFTFSLEDTRSLDDIEMSFTVGAVTITEVLPDIPSSPDPRTVSGSATASGFAVGDTVVVDVSATVNPLGIGVTGVTTVVIPACPPVTDPPATDPPVTDPPATDPPATDPPVTDPPATDPLTTGPPATDPPTTDTPVTDPPATDPSATDPPAADLPETGSETLPAGSFAAVALVVGVGFVVLAARRNDRRA